MSTSLDEFRNQVNKALQGLGARLVGISFTHGEETSVSAEKGTDLHQASQKLGSAAQKEEDNTLYLALEAGGGRLLAQVALGEETEAEKIAGLCRFVLRNLVLEEERDRDALSGFLKKEAFRQRMLEMAAELKKEASRAGKSKKRSPVLSFFHLDLDHFKEINDTLGHRFGDQVLRSFARRVREFLEEKELGEFLLARLGGEEFGILLPYLSSNDAYNLAAELCEFIGTTRIPTPREVEEYRRDNPDFKAISLPGVTASIGTATADSTVILRASPEALEGELDQLYERADVATYVAKKLGRDRVMSFERILAEGGTVLDYDERTGVVTIDLGTDMGVDAGDVFKVYDNRKFTGSEPIIQPGSQNKVIGYFPRLVLGEIEVIQAQPQVSFAMRRGAETFIPAPGFFLELLPPSERGRRVSGDRRKRDRRKAGKVSPRSLFEARLRESQAREKFMLVLIYFDNMGTIKEQRGSSTLKELYRSLAAEFEKLSVPGDVVSTISAEYIGFLPAAPEEKTVKSKLSELKRSFAARDKATWSAVIFSGSREGFDRSRALPIARKGAEIARFKGVDQVLTLEPEMFFAKLRFYHQHGEYDKVAAEYRELSSLGLEDEDALICYAEALGYLGKLEEAVQTAHRVLDEDPHNLTALEVVTSSAFELGHYREAVEAFQTLKKEKKGKLAAWQWRDFGIALLYLGETEQALANLERALSADKTDASAIYHKGEVLLAMGSKEKARKEFLKAFELGFRELSPNAAKLLGEG